MDDLDLENGDSERASLSPEERARIASEAASTRRKAQSQKKTGTGSRAKAMLDKIDSELASRIDRSFDKLADWIANRGDDELADAIREDKGPIGSGLVSVTRKVKFLRGPLFMFLSVFEIVLSILEYWADSAKPAG